MLRHSWDRLHGEIEREDGRVYFAVSYQYWSLFRVEISNVDAVKVMGRWLEIEELISRARALHPPADAVDPQARSTGTLSTREKGSA